MLALLLALLISTLVTQATVFVTTIYLHRTVTHRSLVLHPAVAWVFRAWIRLTTGLVVREWVAVHRKHHAFTDEDGDPHSPHLAGGSGPSRSGTCSITCASSGHQDWSRYARAAPDVWDWVFPWWADSGRFWDGGLMRRAGCRLRATRCGGSRRHVRLLLSASINGLATIAATGTSAIRPRTSDWSRG